MTGIFDSGVGGLVSLKKLRELCPFEDIIYLEDRKNAPYGIKGNEEIKNIVKSNIDRLTALGADRVLIACCTASCLLPTLGKDYESRAREIVKPAAFAARIRRLIKMGE